MGLIVREEIKGSKLIKNDEKIVSSSKKIDVEILIVNLMPKKVETEAQFLNIFSESELDIKVDFLRMETYSSKNSCNKYLESYYKTLNEVKDKKYNGVIVTGAPLEEVKFEDVDYWKELVEVFKYIEKNSKSNLFICWGAQAGLYYFHGIEKYLFKEKLFGVYSHRKSLENPFIRDEEFVSPHSRNSYNKKEDIEKEKNLKILAESEEVGVYIASTKDYKNIYISGHMEYDRYRLKSEYVRDIDKGCKKPKNYFKNDNVINEPQYNWKSHREDFFTNWLSFINRGGETWI